MRQVNRSVGPASRMTSVRGRYGDRHGMVLLIVLVVIVLLTFGAYTFSELMISELEATALYGRGVESRLLAESGLELAATYLAHRADGTVVNFYHDPMLFHGVALQAALSPRGQGRVSLIAPVESDPTFSSVRFGFMDESAKININTIAEMEPEEGRNALLYLPNMTFELADALLDYVDEDEEQREFGTESDYYQSLSPPYVARNSPLESLDELLLVRGMTPQLLYGEDLNRNGLLDPNENDGDRSLPYDNADALLDVGLSGYLTVHSRESNRRADGSERINLNNNILTDLYDQLAEEYSEEEAKFIVAYRLFGPSNREGDDDSGGDSGGGSRGGSRSQGGGGSGGGGSSGLTPDQEERVRNAIARGVRGMSRGGTVTRGGMDLSKGASTEIESIYDLIDAEVTGEIDGKNTTLTSPWTIDSLQEYLPILLDGLTTFEGDDIPGRININQARREVLLGVPEMTEQLADAILASAVIGANGEADTNAIAARQTTGWLLTEGLVDLEQMRKLDRWLTARGDVYRVQSLGYFDAGGQFTRLEAIIDATQQPPRIAALRDLTPLGRGVSPQQLPPPTATAPMR